MDINWTYCDDHFGVCTYIKSYCTLEINVLCQLYLNFKTSWLRSYPHHFQSDVISENKPWLYLDVRRARKSKLWLGSCYIVTTLYYGRGSCTF